ncbi:metallopeptidase family protein [Chloroflexota bacterium]
MNRERFEQLVAMAVETLPKEFLDRLENVTVIVQDYPTSNQLTKARVSPSDTLLGLYEGVPLTEHGTHYGLVAPDKITIFQKPIEAECRNDTEIASEIQKVVQHEIAHHFGIDDATLEQIEKAKFRGKGKAS